MGAAGVGGRRVLVVGGLGVLGARVVESFVAAGADVVVADRVPAGLAPSLAPVVHVDVSSSASVEEAVRAAEALLGGSVEVLVNAAGILSEVSVVEMTDDIWNTMLDVNLTGVMRTCRAVLPAMLASRWGRIVNIASNLGTKGGADMSHYAAAKAGIIGFTRSLAWEVSSANVLVNCVSPGPFHTPMFEKVSPEWKEAKLRELPLGRFGHAEEVAPAVLLLASEPGGNLFVGQNLGPNSGDVFL
jgi:3-oxoacyl-[acyl-carrier protein] reductase